MVVSTSAKITEVLDAYTSKPNGIPGVVFRAINKDGVLLYEGASGVRGLDHKDQPMTLNAGFWIASCTKLLTAVAALQLVEQGKIALGDLAEKYVPEIGTLKILTAFDPSSEPILQEPKTKITIHHLLSHTAGFNYDFFNPLVQLYAGRNNIPSFLSFKRSSLFNPLTHEPGTKWEYGTGIDWVGLIIEKVSGQTLGAFIQQHISEPLGIKSITFTTADYAASNHAFMHARLPDKALKETEPMIAIGEVELQGGGGGAHSSAADYTTVLHALLNSGVGTTGNRILKTETVDLLFADQTTPMGILMDIPPIVTANPTLTNTVAIPPVPKVWTYAGLRMDIELPTGRSSGSVWWCGLSNCYWWIDRTKGVAGMLCAQVLPFYDEEITKCMNEVEQLVYAGTLIK